MAYARTMHRLSRSSTSDFSEVWRQIKEYGAAFENYFHTRQEKIFELISKYSGYEWNKFAEPTIYTYPVIGVPSFSHPLTINLKKDPIVTLGVFIHELLHNNMYFEFPSAELQECVMSTIALFILKDLALEDSEYYKFASEVFEKRFEKKFSLIEELKSVSVKTYLQNRNSSAQ